MQNSSFLLTSARPWEDTVALRPVFKPKAETLPAVLARGVAHRAAARAGADGCGGLVPAGHGG